MEAFRRYGFDKPLAGATLGLIILGIVMVFSASGVMSGDKYHQTFYFFINQILGAVVGVGLVVGIISIRRAFFESRIVIYGLLALSLGLLILCFLMPSIAHTNRWVQFSGVRFQPSELAKISLVLFLSSYFEQKKEKIGRIKTLILPAGVLLFFVLLILKEPDFGTALLIFAVSGLMFFLAGARLRDLAVLGLIFGVLFTVFLLSSPYRRDRLVGFISPEKDPLGQAFQVNQAKLSERPRRRPSRPLASRNSLTRRCFSANSEAVVMFILQQIARLLRCEWFFGSAASP